MGSNTDGDDYESLAALVAVAIAVFAKHRDTLLLLVFVEDEDSRRLRHVVDARDRRERGAGQPSGCEAHTECFPSPHLQSFICMCAEMLWCSELVRVCMYVVERLPLLIIFRDNVVKQNNPHIRFSL